MNAGRQAVLLLQQGLFDIDTKVSADGLVGLQMPKAAALVAEAASNYLNDACSVTLWNYYLNLGYFLLCLRKFVLTKGGDKGGYITRAESFMSSKYRFSSIIFYKSVG